METVCGAAPYSSATARAGRVACRQRRRKVNVLKDVHRNSTDDRAGFEFFAIFEGHLDAAVYLADRLDRRRQTNFRARVLCDRVEQLLRPALLQKS